MTSTIAEPSTLESLRADREAVRQQLAAREQDHNAAITDHDRVLADHAAGRADPGILTVARAAVEDAQESALHLRQSLARLDEQLQAAEHEENERRLADDLDAIIADCASRGRELNAETLKAAAVLIPRYRELIERCGAAKSIELQLMRARGVPAMHRHEAGERASREAWLAYPGLGMVLMGLTEYATKRTNREEPVT